MTTHFTNSYFHQGGKVREMLPCCPVEWWTRQSYELLEQTDMVRQHGQLIYCALVESFYGWALQSSTRNRSRLGWICIHGKYRTVA
jgi:hypothetical protein